MIDLTVKTLDSQNRSFSVPDDFTVEQFKQHISESVSIPVESQRLIYCGRVLDDEKKLFDYNLNGKVVHLVERLPPSRLGPSSNSDGNNDGASNRSSRDSRPDRVRTSVLRRNRLGSQANGGNAMYLGAMAFPPDLIDTQGLHIPQLGGRRLLQSRFDLATYMADQLEQVVNRLEQAPNPEQASAPEQPSAPPESASSAESSENNANVSDPLEFPSFLVHAAVAGAFGAEATVEVEIRPELEEQVPESAPRNETADTQNTNANGAGGSASASSSASTNESENQSSSSNSQRRVSITPAHMGALLQRIEGINERFRPFMRQYTELMLNDPVLPATGENSVEQMQRIVDGVSEALHFQGHLQHALSEFIFDVAEAPPRLIRCRPLLIQQSTVFQSSIPIQAVIPTRNAPSAQSQNAAAAAAAAEDTPEDEDATDREMEVEVEGGESAESEQTNNAPEPPPQFTPAPEQPTQPTEAAANGTSSTTPAPAQNQPSSNTSNTFRRSSRINFPITGRSGGRRSALSSLVPNTCFDPFLPCNSHHIRERRRNYFTWPPGAAIGQITTVTGIPATVEVSTSSENQGNAGSYQQQTQASGNQASPDAPAQGGSAESDQGNAQGNPSVSLRFIEESMAMAESISTARFNTNTAILLGNRAGSNTNGNLSGNGGNRQRAHGFIGMSPSIVEMISEPVINLVANSDGQSRVIRLPPGNYASMFSEMATEMANMVSASAATASSHSNPPLLSTLLSIACETTTFEDIISSTNGNIPLLNVFSYLRGFIQSRIPSLGTYQPSSTQASDLILNSYHLPIFRRPVRDALSELEASVNSLLENVAMRNEHVDVISSVMNVIEVELYMFLGILVYSSDARSFQRMIYCEIEHFARKMFHVLFNCCQQGLEGLHQIAQAFITRVMESNISKFLKMWIVHATVSFLRANLIINPESSDLLVLHQRQGEEGTSNGSAVADSTRQPSSSTSPSAPPTTSISLTLQSGSSLMNLMCIVSRNLSLGDAVRLSCGIRVSLANVGTQLQDFLRRRFPSVRNLQRGSSAPTDIIRNSYGLPEFRSPVRELYSELRASVSLVLSFAEMRDDVDAVASVMEVIESRLYVFLGVLFFSADWESFEVMIRSELNVLARSLITTVFNCCQCGREGLLQVSQGFLRSYIPQPLSMWVVYSTISYLRSMLGTNMQRSNEFVKLKKPSVQSTTNDSNTVTSSSDQRKGTGSQAAAAAPANDVPAPTIPRSPSCPQFMDSDSIELPPLNSSIPNEPLPEVSIGSEDWHNHLRRQDLQEWVPIIARDTQFQRRQSPQRPFSDAYLSGMPNKRRRLITTAKPQSGRVSQFISESLERAINGADVGTSTVTNAVVQHAAVDPTLRAAYVQQLRSRTDLSSNPDFNPSKYPNANNYFKKK